MCISVNFEWVGGQNTMGRGVDIPWVGRAPDKLRICVFYAMKTSKNACIIRSECTFTHTYCCVSKLSKFGAYLYDVDDNTSCT